MWNKKILISTWTFYPAWSYWWIARVMYDLAIELKKDWNTVDCITTDVFDNTSRIEKSFDEVDWLNIFYFKNLSNKIANRLKFPIPLWLTKWLNENISKYDVVQIGDFRNIFNFIVYFYCRKYKIPYVVSPFWTVPFKSDIKAIFKKIFDLTWSKSMIFNAKAVTVQTDSEFDEVKNFWVKKERIKLVPLMVNYDKFSNLPQWGLVRKKHWISEKSKMLLFVWRIHEYKATDMMLDVFYDYQKVIPDSYLIIIWRDDWYEDLLKEYAKKLWIDDKVLFIWAIYFPENINYYIDSDIYFMAPSHWEETSTASLEALSCGTPVVVTEQADIPFLNNYNAWSVVKFDRGALLEALLKVKNKDSESCKSLIKDHFDVKAIKNEFINIYFN